MSDADIERIASQIDLAYDLADRGAHDAAALAFSLARRLVVTLGDDKELKRRVSGNIKTLVKEREQYREILAGRRTADRKLLIVADSLGLPRPEERSGRDDGVDRTYPAKLLDRLPDHEVQSYCQRYFTTQHVIDLLYDDPDLGVGADVVIHVGLNDCANRMFQEDERIAALVLPEELNARLVGFAQKHRRSLLRRLPGYHYVDPPTFRSNLEQIVSVLRRRDARRIVLATIILPPIRFWPATPGIQRNFGRYNLAIMEVAAHHDAVLMDIDRQVWARLHEGALLGDGMHLSEAGHELFADQVASLVS